MARIFIVTILILLFVMPCFAGGKRRRGNSRLTPELARLIIKVSRENQIDPMILLSIASQESGFNVNARSNKGAQGMLQFIPATAQRFGVNNPFNPEDALGGACRYLIYLRNLFDDDLELVLAGYNAGENAVIRAGRRVPPYQETQNYVRAIVAAYRRSKQLQQDIDSGKRLPAKSNAVTTQEIKSRLKVIDSLLH